MQETSGQLALNLEVLTRRWPELAQRIGALSALHFPDLAVRKSEAGWPYLVLSQGGRLLELDDPRDPARRAKERVAAARSDTELMVIEGIGLGYELKAAIARKALRTVVVIEPRAPLFALALSVVDLRRALSDPRLELFVESEPAGICSWFKHRFNYGTEERNLLVLLPIFERLRHPLFTASDGFAGEFARRWDEVAVISDRNRRTLGTFVDIWRRNLFRNIPGILGSDRVARLAGAARGCAGFLVGAGPSLDRNARELRAARGKSVIVAVDTAYRTLIANGVTPDYVIAVDATEENLKDFRGVERVADATSLVMVPVVRPEIARLFPGRYVASYGHPVQKWIETELRVTFGSLLVSGSVATIGFDLLRSMKASPIVLVGMDLAFEGGTHTRSYYTPPVDRFDSIERQVCLDIGEATHRRSGWKGGHVATTEQMLRWAEWYEKEFARVPWKVINATEGGVALAGSEPMSLDRAVAKFARRSVSLPRPDKGRDEWRRMMIPALQRLEAGDRGDLDRVLYWESGLHGENELAENREETMRLAGEALKELREGTHVEVG